MPEPTETIDRILGAAIIFAVLWHENATDKIEIGNSLDSPSASDKLKQQLVAVGQAATQLGARLDELRRTIAVDDLEVDSLKQAYGKLGSTELDLIVDGLGNVLADPVFLSLLHLVAKARRDPIFAITMAVGPI
jgi:hypothetical protein